MNEDLKDIPVLTKEDFKVKDPVKWCSGCGGHAVLSSVQNALPEVGIEKEKIVFVSGIGCSSRFPYYINTYGFHGLHGRAVPVASGIKIAHPELSVWVVTGDGDLLAIGGNHFLHVVRRNIDMNILLFNNMIYGLTKGQYSPTTPLGGVTKTSPDGTVENPLKPGELTIGAQGTFFARAVDTDPKLMKDVFVKAAMHKGTSVVEVLQNCVIFANDAHAIITNKESRDDNQLVLEHGKPMIYGKEKNKGIVLEKNQIKAVKIGENGYKEDDILVHDATLVNPSVHFMLASMSLPDFPVAMGVIRAVESPSYATLLYNQISYSQSQTRLKTMDDLLRSGNVFEVK
jgi:2-oxoglutarate/2-oxoacid ferredoxin oxidoreductase subunit beta